jgi:hypothetical protein
MHGWATCPAGENQWIASGSCGQPLPQLNNSRTVAVWQRGLQNNTPFHGGLCNAPRAFPIRCDRWDCKDVFACIECSRDQLRPAG